MLAILNNYFFFLFLTSLAVSNNLVFFFISWVGLNISLYGILLKSFNSYSKEITLKYFISGSIITMFLLFSVLLYFIEYFTFDFDSANYLFFCGGYSNFEEIAVSSLSKVFYSILLSSLLFKLGAFPFHFYLPDMYQALNEKETMFLYTISLKIAIFVVLLKILTSFWYLNGVASDLLICSGFGSIFVSSFSILKQYKLSKFWAYSYLNSIGFTVLALSSGVVASVGEISFYSAKVYFFSYMIVWFGILDFISNVRIRSMDSFIDKKLYYLGDLVYLSSPFLKVRKTYKESLRVKSFFQKPSYAFSLLISSLFGLPPAIGFFSKALVYFDLSSNSQTILVFWLTVAISPLIAFAYLKLILYSIVGFGSIKLPKLKGNNVFIFETESSYFITYRSITVFTVLLPYLYFHYNLIYNF